MRGPRRLGLGVPFGVLRPLPEAGEKLGDHTLVEVAARVPQALVWSLPVDEEPEFAVTFAVVVDDLFNDPLLAGGLVGEGGVSRVCIRLVGVLLPLRGWRGQFDSASIDALHKPRALDDDRTAAGR